MGTNSKLSSRLSSVKQQLKRGKTLGRSPRELLPDEIDRLIHERDLLASNLKAKESSRFAAQAARRHRERTDYLGQDLEVQSRTKADDLYIMQNSRIPGEVKIGRSVDVIQRRNQLQASGNFYMKTNAIFRGYGYLEYEIHPLLETQRVQNVAGVEWYYCEPEDAITLIHSLILPAQTDPYMSE